MLLKTQSGSAVSGRVLARVAQHELAGPLLLQRQLLASARERLSDEVSQEVGLVEDCVADMLAVLDLLRALGDPTGPAPPVPLSSVLDRTRRRYPDLAIAVTGPAGRSAVDGCRAPAVVGNLVANVEQHADRAASRTLRCARRGGHVQLVLRQSGPRPAAVDEALRRADPPDGRHGLGLWLVRLLAHQMGAGLSAVSDPVRQDWELRLRLPVLPSSGVPWGSRNSSRLPYGSCA